MDRPGASPNPIDDPTLLEKLARQVPGVLYQFVRHADGRYAFPFASDGIREIYEVAPEEVREDAEPVVARLHPDDLAATVESIEVSAQRLTPWRHTYRVLLPQRGLRWLRGDARPERRPDGSVLWHGYIADVTDQESAREALRESERRFRIQFEHAPDAIIIYDVAADRLIDANRLAEALFGCSREELLTRGAASLSPDRQPDGRDSAVAGAEYVASALRGETPVFEWRYRNAQGDDILCDVKLAALPFDGRTLLRCSITDIRERRRLDLRLRQLEAAIASSISAVAIAGLDGRLTYVNQAFLDLWGHHDAREVLGRPAVSFWEQPAEATAVVDALGRDGAWSGELTARRTDGSRRTVALRANVFRDAAGAPLGMLASFVDVTEERALQERLRQAERLESVGRLAGGIAHDFNNLLTVIQGYVELSQATVADGDPLHANLREVGHASESAARLTRQLLAFSRQQIIAPRPLDLNAVVTRITGMLQRLIGEHIQLDVITEPALGTVRFDPGQAEQVLVNLAVNARDAMPEGGRLTIETANVLLDEHYTTAHPHAPPGAYVLLAVTDTGLGMSAETREHAFEPFYTTKQVGQGTGLGLAMIHGAVLQNGGRIEVYSEPGDGSCFKIYLPRVEAAVPAPAPARPPIVTGGTECILVVEDDDAVRALAERLLRRLGYAVTAHRNGDDALAWLAGSQQHVHLLFTDVVMPRMNGRVLAERVQAMRPAVRVLFTSGYTPNVIVQQGVLKPGVEFLAKPYAFSALARRVREVLDGSPTTGSAR